MGRDASQTQYKAPISASAGRENCLCKSRQHSSAYLFFCRRWLALYNHAFHSFSSLAGINALKSNIWHKVTCFKWFPFAFGAQCVFTRHSGQRIFIILSRQLNTVNGLSLCKRERGEVPKWGLLQVCQDVTLSSGDSERHMWLCCHQLDKHQITRLPWTHSSQAASRDLLNSWSTMEIKVIYQISHIVRNYTKERCSSPSAWFSAFFMWCSHVTKLLDKCGILFKLITFLLVGLRALFRLKNKTAGEREQWDAFVSCDSTSKTEGPRLVWRIQCSPVSKGETFDFRQWGEVCDFH